MGCSNCGGGGTPGGCQNNGTCSSGGCNKLEVYDWLGNMEPANGQTPYDIVEIRFKNSRKGFYRNTKNHSLHVGDVVVVEGSPGQDIGVVSIVGELTRRLFVLIISPCACACERVYNDIFAITL